MDSVPTFSGDSGDGRSFALESSTVFCLIICSNFSIKRSLVSLACSILRSSTVRRGINVRSMALTASYSAARVSGNGDRKYSSRASNNKGWFSESAVDD